MDINTIPKRGILLAILGITILLISSLFLTEQVIVSRSYNGDLIIPPKTYNYTKISLTSGDNITCSLTSNSSQIPHVYISTEPFPSNESIIYNIICNENISTTFNKPLGTYFIIFINNYNTSLMIHYSIVIYRFKTKELYGGIPSLAGVVIILFSLMLLYVDYMNRMSEKYPDRITSEELECWSTKLNKHTCLLRGIYIPEEEMYDLAKTYFETLGYKESATIGEAIIFERKRLFSRRKPSTVIISPENEGIKLYYNTPPIRASGTIDLKWIYEEAKGFLETISSKRETIK